MICAESRGLLANQLLVKKFHNVIGAVYPSSPSSQLHIVSAVYLLGLNRSKNNCISAICDGLNIPARLRTLTESMAIVLPSKLDNEAVHFMDLALFTTFGIL